MGIRKRDPQHEQEQIRKGFEAVCPNILDNPYLNGHWPMPAQAVFLGLHLRANVDPDDVFMALYGGAAGGGKSDSLLMAAAQYAWKEPDFSAILFRRTYADLVLPGALLDRALEWWVPAGVAWEAGKSMFRFPNGAKVVFAHLRNPLDHLKYQGSNYQFSGWDELTQWASPSPYEYVGYSRMRRPAGSALPLRTLSASNPGGPGHNWVKEMFVGGTDTQTGEDFLGLHSYVPAKVSDNPHLDRAAYIRTLSHLNPLLLEQLLNGDWSARAQGDYFRAEWFGRFLDPETETWNPEECARVRWWDLAASEDKSASMTSGVRLARHVQGVRAIEHCRSGRWMPGMRDDVILQTAQADGRTVTVGIEIEPGSGGIAQFLSLEKRLKLAGFKVAGARPQSEMLKREGKLLIRQPGALGGKAGRADPVSSCLYRGYLRRGEAPRTRENEDSPYLGIDIDKPQRDGLRIFAGPWVSLFLDHIEGFPPETGKEGVDDVDALSGAFAYLEANPAGVTAPLPDYDKPKKLVDTHDTHPEDLPEDFDAGKDDRGHWTP